MAEQNVSFDVGSNFDRGELSGNLHLGKFEAYYEALFAEVIDDGVITPEERQRLDRAAETLGLDRARLRRLEEALQAAYESRHKVRILEVETGDDDSPPRSLQPLEVATDTRTLALQRRIEQLEARIVELERELEEARTYLPVQIDMSEFSRPPVLPADESPADLEQHLRTDPRNGDLLHALFRAWTRLEQWDRRANAAHALVFVGEATAEERAVHESTRSEGLIRPKAALSADGWSKLLIHPDQEPLVGEILSVVASAVLLGRVSAMRRDKLLVRLSPEQRQTASETTVQAVRSLAWAATLLGMQTPAMYVDPQTDGLLEIVAGLPPATRLHGHVLRGRSPADLAFVSGRHMTYYRPDHFLRALLPAIADLEDIFLAALAIGNPGLPLSAQTKARVAPIAKAIEPILDAAAIDRLRGHFLRFVEEGGRTNLQRWAAAVDLTAARAGLLLADDLAAAQRMLNQENAAHADEHIDDLLRFAVSERYSKLRRQMGIATAAPAAGGSGK